MKKIIFTTISILLIVSPLAGCGNDDSFSAQPSASLPAESRSTESSTTEETDDPDSPEPPLLPAEPDENAEDTVSVNVQIGSNDFTAVLYNNASAEALADMMPMTLDMSELNGNEKYYYIPGSLPSTAENIGSIQAGDLMLYGTDCLVLFYEDFQTSYSYTRLGYIEDPVGLKEALGSGSVEVTFIRN